MRSDVSSADPAVLLQNRLGNIPVPVTAQVATCTMSARDLATLCPGKVIVLKTKSGLPLELKSDGITLAQGKAVHNGTRLGLQIHLPADRKRDNP